MDGRILRVGTFCAQVAVVHDWKADEKNSMRRVFEHGLRVWPALVKSTHAMMGTFVLRANERGYDWKKVSNFDLELVVLADQGKFDEAVAKLATGFKQFAEEFWPDCDLEVYKQFLTEYSAHPLLQSKAPCSQSCSP